MNTQNNIAHFFIACVELTFVDAEGNTGVTRLNTMIRSDTNTVGVLLLGRAQQAAQIQLIKSLNDPSINVLNVVFVSISYLGAMSDEDFHRTEEAHGHV